MFRTMRAVVLDAPGSPSALTVRRLPIPIPATGWVLIKVNAFGLNRLELDLQGGRRRPPASGPAGFPRRRRRRQGHCPGRTRVYRFDQIVQAHTDMEQNRTSGKLVVTT